MKKTIKKAIKKVTKKVTKKSPEVELTALEKVKARRGTL